MIEWVGILTSAVFLFFGFNIVANLLFSWYSRSSASQAKESPLISIIVPARNEESNLQALLPSILRQSYNNFELLVYDDSSTDQTAAVVQSFENDQIKLIKGTPLKEGWVGKVHALYMASKEASGSIFLFLDADTVLLKEESLQGLLDRFLGQKAPSILSGLPSTGSGGQILVSLLPFVLLAGAPWYLSTHLPFSSMTVLNGQFWMIRRQEYESFEPHKAVKDKILEDVEIGRYMKRNGVATHFGLVTDLIKVNMYENLRSAIHGLSKNAYLILGGTPIPFLFLWLLFCVTLILSPLFGVWSDRIGRVPLWVSIFAPVSMIGAGAVQLYSAILHWTGRVSWKNRSIKT